MWSYHFVMYSVIGVDFDTCRITVELVSLLDFIKSLIDFRSKDTACIESLRGQGALHYEVIGIYLWDDFVDIFVMWGLLLGLGLVGTRYSGHLFSRLARFFAIHDQTEAFSYYERASKTHFTQERLYDFCSMF
jgi:hypothetical protein